MTIPNFFDAKNSADYHYQPNQRQLLLDSAGYRSDNSITSAITDRMKVNLLLIDLQRDFCFPEGSLYVAGQSGNGAIEDSTRISEFIYRNMNQISQVTTTLDTHFSVQIFFPFFWVDETGANPEPHTVITADDIRKGIYKPNPAIVAAAVGNKDAYAWLLQYVIHYCEELEAAGKYQLYLWPEHCLIGSDGYALTGVIHEARLFHAFVRGTQSLCEIKGGNPLTENYSILRPEVLTRHDGQPLAQKNTTFINTLLKNDRVIIAGQAASHCVASSIDDLLEEIKAVDPALAQKVYVMEDCMSSVTVPDGQGGFLADFTPQADAALQRYRDAGMHVVKSTEFGNWVDFEL